MRDVSHIIDHYSSRDEEARFASKSGSVEYLTTMRYIEKYLAPQSKILEIGAGTGRYSHALARIGYEVDAVELVQANIEVLKNNTLENERITINQGDALDLSRYNDNTFDLTLLLGPMYHLYNIADKLRALSEALRVTKPDGVLFVAYCISDGSVIDFGFKRGEINNLIAKNMLETVTFRTFSSPPDVLELCRKEDVDALISRFYATRLHYVATDLYTRYIRETVDEMDDATFSLYLQYHFAICEREDMVGITHHALDIIRKD